ncbi:MAG: phosphoethanolamine transferase [Paludibacteraceae bacterium]
MSKHVHISSQTILKALLVLIIFTPYVLGACIATDLTDAVARLLYVWVGVMWIVLPAIFLKTRAFFVWHSITLLLGLIECVHLIMYQATTSLLFVYTIVIAEPGEFLELCSTGWPLIVGVLLFFTTYFWLVFKKTDNKRMLTNKQRWGATVCEILTIVFLIGTLQHTPTANAKRWYLPIKQEHFNTEVRSTCERVFPLNLIRHTTSIVRMRHTIDAAGDKLCDFSFGITQPQHPHRQIVVLVIGETARYGNFGLNGYERNTTPRLCARSNLITFDSIYSIANLTTVSVPFMLSRATPQNKELYVQEKSVVEAFAESGYKTAWIANQSFGNQLLMRISETCDYTHYIPSDKNNHANLDIRLLEYLQPFINTYTNPEFIVLHSLGCHYKYNCRYPPDFAQFTPDLNSQPEISRLQHAFNIPVGNDTGTPEKLRAIFEESLTNKPLRNEVRSLLVNSYDNAILYTDFFLDSTISILEATDLPCVLLYIGDHGENLLDDDRNLMLHGTYGGSAYEYHVPMFVWYSDNYRQTYPDKIARLQQHTTCKTSSMILFNTLLDFGDIDVDNIDCRRSLASEHFEPDTAIYGLDANMQLIKIPTEQ